MDAKVSSKVFLDVAICGALVSSAVAAFNGVLRYEHAQLAAACVLLVPAGALAWARRRSLRGALGAASLAGLMAAWVGLRALVGGSAAELDTFALWWGVAALLVGGAAASDAFERRVSGTLSVVAALVALVSLLQLLGVALPPPIPFVDGGGWGRATFDHPTVAAAWGAVVCALCASQVDAGTSRVGWLGALGGALIVGLARDPFAVGALAAALVAGVALGRRGVPRASAVALGVALVVALVRPEPAPLTETERMAAAPRVAALEVGPPVTVDADGYRAYAVDAALSHAGSNWLLGGGAGSTADGLMRSGDSDSAYARARTEGRVTGARSPVPLLDVLGDFGVLGAAMVVGFLGLAFVVAARRRSSATPALVAGAVLAFTSPGLLHVAPLLALAAAVAFAGRAAGEGTREANPPWGVAAILVALLALPTAYHVVRSTQWAYAAASSVVFFGHGDADNGSVWAERAARMQTRYVSEMNAALASRLSGEWDMDASESHLRTAVQLRDSSVPARARLAEVVMRRSVGTPASEGRVGRARQMFDYAGGIDPNDLDLAVSRATAAVAQFDHRAAVAVLEAYLARDVADSAKAFAAFRLGEVYEDAGEPAEALAAFVRAIEMTEDEGFAQRAAEQAARMEAWEESGVRPRGEGHDHDH